MVGFIAAGPSFGGGGRAARAAVSSSSTLASRPDAGAVMVGWHEDGDDVDLLRAHETELGTRFALVRMYQQWQLPSRRVATMIEDGRLVLVSHKPPAAGWAAVASGAEDAMVEKLAAAYKAFGREVLFTFHHEPHDDASDVKGGTSGTAAEYLAAWSRIRSIFDRVGASHSVGGNVFFAYSATASWALKSAPGGPPGSGDPLYPGDELVDVFAHDRYNWASCRNDGWEEFGAEWAPLVALAAAHHKPLLAAEFGAPPSGGARNDWFRNAAAWLKSDPLARQWMWGFAYFHTLHDSCPWDFLNQPGDGGPGWQAAFRDPYFTGTPFSLASRASLTLEGAGTAAPSPGVLTPPKPTSPIAPPVTTTTLRRTTPGSIPPPAGPGAGSGAPPSAGTSPSGISSPAGESPGLPTVSGAAAPLTAAAGTATAGGPAAAAELAASPGPTATRARSADRRSTAGAVAMIGLLAALAAALVARRLTSL